MKKKLLILAAVAVSGLAAVVASNTNKVFGESDADAHFFEFTCLHNGVRYGCCDITPAFRKHCYFSDHGLVYFNYPGHEMIFEN